MGNNHLSYTGEMAGLENTVAAMPYRQLFGNSGKFVRTCPIVSNYAPTEKRKWFLGKTTGSPYGWQ